MPAMVRALLRVGSGDVVEGERSSKLWQIECLLGEAGWGEDAIYGVVEGSAWNKWAGVATGERRLRAEIRKALHHVQRQSHHDREALEPPQEGLPWVRYSSFMSMTMEEPRWLIEGLWTAGSHGILGGEPKTSKTTLALGMAIAVASGAAFLGDPKYPVHTPGPVLLVQEENAPWMVQDRMKKIAALSGLIGKRKIREHEVDKGGLSRTVVTLEFPTDIPMRLLNNYGLDLTTEEHRDAIWAECEMIKPSLVVLDPLYMIFAGVDFNAAHELAPYLKWLLALSNEFNCSVCIVHHLRKQSQQVTNVRIGQRLMGSATLHGFVDSALYAEQMDPETVYHKLRAEGMTYTRLEREFRAIEPQKALELAIGMGQPGQLGMNVSIAKWDLQRAIEEMAIEQPGVTARQIAKSLDVNPNVVLGRCRDSTTVVVKTAVRGRGQSYRIYPQTWETNGDGT
jgi:hypothetical protein